MTPSELYPVLHGVLNESRLLWQGSEEAPAVRQVVYDLAVALGEADPGFDHAAFILACGFEWPVPVERGL